MFILYSKRFFRYVLCIVLSIALIIGLLPARAFADVNTDSSTGIQQVTEDQSTNNQGLTQNLNLDKDQSSIENFDLDNELDFSKQLTSGTGSELDPYVVNNFDEFTKTLKENQNNNNIYINLGNDFIDNKQNIDSDSLGDINFNGVIDGQGHTLTISSLWSLFDNVKGNFTISNLVFDVDIYIADYITYGANFGIGSFAKSIEGNVVFTNCILKGKIELMSSDTNTYVGGLIGIAKEGSSLKCSNIENHIVINNYSDKDKMMGGLVGYSKCKDIIIDNCNNGNDMSINSKSVANTFRNIVKLLVDMVLTYSVNKMYDDEIANLEIIYRKKKEICQYLDEQKDLIHKYSKKLQTDKALKSFKESGISEDNLKIFKEKVCDKFKIDEKKLENLIKQYKEGVVLKQFEINTMKNEMDYSQCGRLVNGKPENFVSKHIDAINDNLTQKTKEANLIKAYKKLHDYKQRFNEIISTPEFVRIKIFEDLCSWINVEIKGKFSEEKLNKIFSSIWDFYSSIKPDECFDLNTFLYAFVESDCFLKCLDYSEKAEQWIKIINKVDLINSEIVLLSTNKKNINKHLEKIRNLLNDLYKTDGFNPEKLFTGEDIWKYIENSDKFRYRCSVAGTDDYLIKEINAYKNEIFKELRSKIDNEKSKEVFDFFNKYKGTEISFMRFDKELSGLKINNSGIEIRENVIKKSKYRPNFGMRERTFEECMEDYYGADWRKNIYIDEGLSDCNKLNAQDIKDDLNKVVDDWDDIDKDWFGYELEDKDILDSFVVPDVFDDIENSNDVLFNGLNYTNAKDKAVLEKCKNDSLINRHKDPFLEGMGKGNDIEIYQKSLNGFELGEPFDQNFWNTHDYIDFCNDNVEKKYLNNELIKKELSDINTEECIISSVRFFSRLANHAYGKISSISKSLLGVCNSINSEYDVSSDITNSTYAGGFIGYCDGDSSHLLVVNSTSYAYIQAGSYAGGFIGHTKDVDSSFINCENCGVITCTNCLLTPAAGGVIGLSSGSGRESLFSCINSGYIVSRESSGGLIGEVDGFKSVVIDYCSSVSGISGEDSVGGMIGYVDYCKDVHIENSYTCCAFDTALMTKTVLPFSYIPVIGAEDGNKEISKNDLSKFSKPGAIVGDVNDVEKVNIYNCSYVNGAELIGENKTTDKMKNDKSLRINALSKEQFYNGAATFLLNGGATSKEEGMIFGQVLDDFSCEIKSRQYLPVFGLNAPVYKDDVKPYEFYSNFNPRTTELCEVQIFNNGHMSVNPCVSKISCKKNDSFKFDVDVDDGYAISDIQVNDKSIDNPYSEDLGIKANITIPNIIENSIIKIFTNNIGYSKPKGYGTEFDPYRITKKSELKWLSKVADTNGSLYQAYIVLENDIDFEGEEWSPVCAFNIGFAFGGTFDGKNHKIYNIKSDKSENFGFFSGIDGGTVKNLIIEGNFKDSFIAYSAKKAQIQNCVVKGSLSSSNVSCGAIAANICNGTIIDNCINYANIKYQDQDKNGDGAVGGIVGHSSDDSYISLSPFTAKPKNSKDSNSIINCINYGNIEIVNKNDFNMHIGGILGAVGGFKKMFNNYFYHRSQETRWYYDDIYDDEFNKVCYEIAISQCENNGNLYISKDSASISKTLNEGATIGGVLGGPKDVGSANAKIDKCINNGFVGLDNNQRKTMTYSSGGILGSNYHSLGKFNGTINNSLNTGLVATQEGYAGGALGLFDEDNTSINFKNVATLNYVDTDNGEVGMFFCSDQITSDDNIECKNCYCLYTDQMKTIFNAIKYIPLIPKPLIDKRIYLSEIRKYNDDNNINDLIGGITSLEKEDPIIKNGELAFKLNGHKTNETNKIDYSKDQFGQNIDFVSAKCDNTPRIINCFDSSSSNYEIYSHDRNNECPKRVYLLSEKINNKEYSNYDLDCATSELNLVDYKYNHELGTVEGPSFVKKGDDVNVTISPVNKGIIVAKVTDNGIDVTDKLAKNNQLILENFEKNHQVDVTFGDEKEPEIVDGIAKIRNSFELKWFANNINNGKQCNAILMNDIFIPSDLFNNIQIGNRLNPFISSFNGQGHTVELSDNKALFGYLGKDSIVDNLRIIYKDNNKPKDGFKAVLADFANGASLSSIQIDGEICGLVEDFGVFVNTIEEYGCSINNCTNKVNILKIENNPIIIVSCFVCQVFSKNKCDNETPVSITKCTNKGTIDVTTEYILCAGVIGNVCNIENINLYINDFNNYSNITSKDKSSGVLGTIENTSGKIEIKTSNNHGMISGNSITTGFLLSVEQSRDLTCDLDINIIGCENSGDIYGNHGFYVSAFVGFLELDVVNIEFIGCLNRAKNIDFCSYFLHDNDYMGSFVALCNILDSTKSSLSFDDCLNVSPSLWKPLLFCNINNNLKVNYNNCFNLNDKTFLKNISSLIIQHAEAIKTLDIGKEFFNLPFPDNVIAICKYMNYKISFNEDTLPDGLEFFDVEDMNSGKITWQLNNLFKNNNVLSGIKVGQIIDIADSNKEYEPRFNSNEVYKLSENIYSNYEEMQEDKCTVIINNKSCAQSHIARNIINVNLENVDSLNINDFAINEFIQIDSCRPINEITLNGKKISNNKWNKGHLTISYQDLIDCYDGKRAWCLKEEINKLKGKIINLDFMLDEHVMPSQDNEGNYQIADGNDLMWLMYQINSANNTDGVNVEKDNYNAVLMNDIDMSNFTWAPIGKENAFYGHIYGNNHTIYNLNGDCGAFIDNADGALIKDLTLDIKFNNKEIGGCIKNAKNCYLDNVHVIGSVSGDVEMFGGVVMNTTGDKDYAPDENETDYEFWDKYNTEKEQKFYRGTRIFNCSSNIDLTNANFLTNSEFGGILCHVINPKSDVKDFNSVNVSNCTNNTSLLTKSKDNKINSYVGGIVGYVSSSCVLAQINSCTNNAEIQGSNTGAILSCAGIINKYEHANNYYLYVSDCENNGYINGDNAGGVASFISGGNCSKNDNDYFDGGLDYHKNNIAVLGFKQNGNIEANATFAGGIFCKLENGCQSNILIKCCATKGLIIGNSSASGFISCVESCGSLSLENNYVDSKISTKTNNSRCGSFLDGVFCGNNKITISSSYYNSIKNSQAVSIILYSNIRWLNGLNNDNCKYDDKAAYSGQLCWQLNELGDKQYYGQNIDGYNNISNQVNVLPDIDCDASVYKREIAINNEKVPFYSNFENEDFSAVKVNVHDTKGNALNFAHKMYYNGDIGYKCQGWNFIKKGNDFRFALTYDDSYYLASSDIVVNGEKTNFDIKDNICCVDQENEITEIDLTFDTVKKPEVDSNDENTYLVSSYSNLRWISNISNSDSYQELKGKIFKLTSDIKSSTDVGNSWKPIGQNHPFTGEINGNHKTLDGITVYEGKYKEAAFIQNANTANIHDLTFTNMCIKADQNCSGLIFNATSCQIDNVHIYGELKSAGNMMAGFVANLHSGKNKTIINNCSEKMEISHACAKNGKVAGFISNINPNVDLEINNCQNESDLYSNCTDDNTTIWEEDWCAGFIAYCNCHNVSLYMKNCQNYATVRGDRSGGIISEIADNESGSSKTTFNFEDLKNFGDVSGTYCGGILGLAKNVNANCSIRLTRCTNLGMIGLIGSVLKDAGGLIGYLDDKDLDVIIDSCMNIGSVLNTLSVCKVSQWITWIATLGIDALGTGSDILDIKRGSNVITKKAAFKTVSIPLYIGVCVFQALLSIINHVKQIITGKMTYIQYAGGICGQFDSLKSLKMNRVINYALVDGQTFSDTISTDWGCDNIKCNEVYALGDKDKIEDYYQTYTPDHFKSGEVCYKLAQSDKDDKHLWRQVLDNYEISTPAVIPSFYNKKLDKDAPIDGTKVYEHKDAENGQVFYSNFPKVDKIEKRDFNIEFYKDKNFSTELADETYNSDIFDVNVSGSFVSSYGNISCEINDSVDGESEGACEATYSCEVLSNDKLHTAIKAKDNYMISDVKVVNNGDDHSDNYVISYWNDGNVDIIAKTPETNGDNIIVKYTNNKPHIHADGNGKEEIYKPWNLNEELPAEEGKYYLTSDVYLDSEYVTPDGSSMLCLDGYDLIFVDKGKVIVSEKSQYQIVDCGEGSNKAYHASENGNIYRYSDASVIAGDFNNETGANVVDNYGVIYSMSENDDNDVYFQNNGSLTINGISIFKLPYTSVIDIDNEKAQTSLNAVVYKTQDKDNLCDDYEAIVDVNSHIENNALNLGCRFVTENLVINNVDSDNFGPDVMFNKSAKDIKFTSINEPIIVGHACGVSDVVLSSDIDQWLHFGISADKLFIPYDKDDAIAYCYDDKNLNTLVLTDKDNTYAVNICESDYGKTYPSNDVKVVKDEKIKISYSANDFADITNITCKAKDDNGDTIDEADVSVEKSAGEIIFDKSIFENIKSKYNLSYNVDPVFFKNSDYAEQAGKCGSKVKLKEIADEKELSVVGTQSDALNVYKLTSDITMHETWNVPDGKWLIDLNGHNINMKQDNKNIICMDNEKASLIMVDNGKNKETNKHYFKFDDGSFIPIDIADDSKALIKDIDTPFTVDENNKFIAVKDMNKPMLNDGDCICVAGGMITGANIGQHEYYLFRQSAAAVKVDTGSFELESGNICGNNSYKVLGGAAISAGEHANVHIGKEARICANSSMGDQDYLSNDFSGAVLSKGCLVCDGIIDNNVSKGYSSASLSIMSGYAENNGKICNNYSFANKEDLNKDSYGTIYNCGQLRNNGLIENNYSNCMRPGLLNAGKLICGKNSNIINNVDFGNNYSTKQAFDIYQKANAQPIGFADQIINEQVTYIAIDDISKTFTESWINTISPAEKMKYLEITNSKIQPSDSKVIALNNHHELQVFAKNDIIYCHFASNDKVLAFDQDVFFKNAPIGYTFKNADDCKKAPYTREYIKDNSIIVKVGEVYDINLDAVKD